MSNSRTNHGNFEPDKYQYVERRNPREPVPISYEDTEYLNKFKSRLQFLSFTFFKPAPSDHLAKLRVYTPRSQISLRILQDVLSERFERGCKVTPCLPYFVTKSFDVQVDEPLRLDVFILTIVKALEKYV